MAKTNDRVFVRVSQDSRRTARTFFRPIGSKVVLRHPRVQAFYDKFGENYIDRAKSLQTYQEKA